MITSKEEDKASLDNFKFNSKDGHRWCIPRWSEYDKDFLQMDEDIIILQICHTRHGVLYLDKDIRKRTEIGIRFNNL